MNLRAVLHAVASVMLMVGVAMLTAVPVGMLMGDTRQQTRGLLLCALATIAFSALAVVRGRARPTFGFREGFAVVSLGWIAASVFGALPYMLVGRLRWYDALFEAMSGFSATGASILDKGLPLHAGGALSQGIADLSYGLIYWRSMTHWLGGMGIVVLSMAILPWLGLGAQQLYRSEVPGPTSDRMTPRIADSARILWAVYVVLSVLETALLRYGGMSLFDAWCHTCGTMATGGFSTRQESLAFYNSAYIDWVVIVFMALAGANFALHFRALRGDPGCLWRDEEFRFYLAVCLVASASTAYLLAGREIVTASGTRLPEVSFPTAFRYAAFQVVSVITTTGFVTADFNLWPAYCGALLILLMFVGGCAGSTAGSMKQARILLLLRYSVLQVERCVFRRMVSNVRFNGQRIDPATLHKALAFFFLFIGIYTGVVLLLCLLGVDDLLTAATAAIACLGNVGPGLGKVGPVCNYAWMTPAAKLLLSFAMLLGRLELYTVLVLFLPSFYR
jgi:trk system potassium uptake protein TrkH